MSDRQFAKIRSWHAIRTPTRVPDTYVTVCGRMVVALTLRDVLPAGERTCETCLRLIVRHDEQVIQRAKPNTGEPFEHEPEDDGSTALTEMVP
jgi:hypothetical protein